MRLTRASVVFLFLAAGAALHPVAAQPVIFTALNGVSSSAALAPAHDQVSPGFGYRSGSGASDGLAS